MWTTDEEMFALMKEQLYASVIGDILDEMGCYHQHFPQAIHPLNFHDKIVGRAMPVLMIDVYGEQQVPFGKLTEALDQLEKNEVYVASGGDMRCAYWGELLTATAKKRGCSGAVINGFYRDSVQVIEQHWPVFSRGRFSQDSRVRTQVADYRCMIEIEGVPVRPADLIFGDVDGVVVIPAGIEQEVVEKALYKAAQEKTVRREIEKGMSSTEAFAVYKVL